MKLKYSILSLVAGLAAIAFSSCSDDDLGASIFDVNAQEIDSTAVTYPLDKWLVENFRKPYNMRFNYKFQDISSDMDYNLTPTSYSQSVTIAALCKYLWYDVYKGVVGEEFLKQYSPRIIQLIGSPAYNPTSGTMKLGTAEGGKKITLYNCENLDPNNIDQMNEYFFKTMHHEFSHILHQNISIPTDFALISNGLYNAASWQDTPDSMAISQGFTSPYASSQSREDWVETIANYITKDTISWNNMLNAANYAWEVAKDVPASYWYSLDALCKAGKANRDSVGYFVDVESTSDDQPATLKIVRKLIQRNGQYAATDDNGKIIYTKPSGSTGREIILKKLDMVRTWLKKNFNYDLEAVRMGVQHRQYLTDDNGNFVFDANGHFINNITYKRADGTTKLDELRKEILGTK